MEVSIDLKNKKCLFFLIIYRIYPEKNKTGIRFIFNTPLLFGDDETNSHLFLSVFVHKIILQQDN